MTRSHASKSDCGKLSKGAYSPAYRTGPDWWATGDIRSQPLDETTPSTAIQPSRGSVRLL